MQRKPVVFPFKGEYRRRRQFVPRLAARRLRRQGPADPRIYLKLVIIIAVVLLALLQVLPDAAVSAFARSSAGDCRIVSVTDGDTVRLWCPARGIEKARLTGFDTPEVFSPKCASELARGTAATWKLRWLLLTAKKVSILRQGRDRYGRTLAAVTIDGVPLRSLMISSGHARAYSGGKRGGWCG